MGCNHSSDGELGTDAIDQKLLAALNNSQNGKSRNSIVLYMDTQKQKQVVKQEYLRKKKMSLFIGDKSQEKVLYLPRGGTYVKTKAGPIQFGIPPETIKDSMKLGLELCRCYVLPKERFNLQHGLNVAEFEFPAYFNFFIKRQKIKLVCTPEVERVIRVIFRETLLGPESVELPDTFSERVPREAYPDLEAEMAYFRRNPFNPPHEMTVDDLIEFQHFEDGVADMGSGVVIRDDGHEFVIVQAEKEYARVPSSVIFAGSEAELDQKALLLETGGASGTDNDTTTSEGKKPSSSSKTLSSPRPKRTETKSIAISRAVTDQKNYFVPPMFGVTMLGNSDGFDASGTTTGFIIWMNRRGIMVDPPAMSAERLARYGISPKLIKAVVLTHCHADHDAGTFQKVLEEGRIVLLTAPVILQSFLRKYSAISGLSVDFLKKLFHYRPITIGEPVSVYGGTISFFFALHTIPCVGFSVTCNGKSLIYSADTFNDPTGIRKIQEEKRMTPERADMLINFPWMEHDVILHEAGVPPIHTSIDYLATLPDPVKERLYIVHKPAKDVPTQKGLKPALVGPEHTIVISDEAVRNGQALEMMDLFAGVDFLNCVERSRALDFLCSARIERYQAGKQLMTAGKVNDRFYIIAMGQVRVAEAADGGEAKEEDGGGVSPARVLGVGDHFGAISLTRGGECQRNVVAATAVELYSISKAELWWIARETKALERLKQLGQLQGSALFRVLTKNSVFSKLSSSQVSYLHSIVRQRSVKKGQVIWRRGDLATEALLVGSGEFYFERAKRGAPLREGVFVLESCALMNEQQESKEEGGDSGGVRPAGMLSTTLKCAMDGTLFAVTREDWIQFVDSNPGIRVFVMNRRFVE